MVPYNGITLRSSDMLSTFGGSKNFVIFKNYTLKAIPSTLSNNFPLASEAFFVDDSNVSQ